MKVEYVIAICDTSQAGEVTKRQKGKKADALMGEEGSSSQTTERQATVVGIAKRIRLARASVGSSRPSTSASAF